jgi:hypothetical protein
VCRQPEHDGLGDVRNGVNRRAALRAIFFDEIADTMQRPPTGSSFAGLWFVNGGIYSPVVTGNARSSFVLPFSLDSLKTTLAYDLLPRRTKIPGRGFSESLEVRTAAATTSQE